MNLPNNTPSTPAAAVSLIDTTNILKNIREDRIYDPLENRFNVNIIGIDFGDGECCAYIGCAERKNGRRVVKRLSLDQKDSRTRPTVIILKKGEKTGPAPELLCDWFSPGAQAQDEISIYSNFKDCPLLPEFTTVDKKTGVTPKLLLQITFRLLVNDLFQYNLNNNNGNPIDPDSPTLLFVGRPSGSTWKEAEKEYAKLLKEALTPKFAEEKNLRFIGKQDYLAEDRKIEVQVVSEVTAAFSKYAGHSNIGQATYIDRNSSGIIADNGSSTLDIMYIDGHKVIGEFSVTFGGRDLDRILEHRMREEITESIRKTIRKNHPDISDEDLEQQAEQSLATVRQLKNDQLLYLARRKKEDFYNNGQGDDDGIVFKIAFTADNQTQSKTIFLPIEEVAAAAAEYPIRQGVQISEDPFAEPLTEIHWMDAIGKIYTAAHEKWQKLSKNRKIDFLILTGGVSKMPPVQAKAREIFAPGELYADEDPSYSVAQGLATFVTEEIVKADYFRGSFDGDIDRFFDKTKTDSLLDCIADAGKKLTYDNHFLTALEQWKNSSKPTTIQNLLMTFAEVLTSPSQYNVSSSLADDISQGILKWIGKESISISDHMKVHCEQYPEVRDLLENYIVTIDPQRLKDILLQESPTLNFGECGNSLQQNLKECFGTNDSPTLPTDSERLAEYVRENGKESILNALKLPYLTDNFRQVCLPICKKILKDAILRESEYRNTMPSDPSL